MYFLLLSKKCFSVHLEKVLSEPYTVMDLQNSCPTMQVFGGHFFCFIVLYLGSG